MICCLQTDKSLANNQCPSEFRLMRNSSTWSDLSQNVQNMDLVDSEAFQELTTQLAELQGIFNHFKDIYVSTIALFLEF